MGVAINGRMARLSQHLAGLPVTRREVATAEAASWWPSYAWAAPRQRVPWVGCPLVDVTMRGHITRLDLRRGLGERAELVLYKPLPP